jgi:antitoxin component YwqK of YwqJK toxin-antitoxin module
MKRIFLSAFAIIAGTALFAQQQTYTENYPSGVKRCEGFYNSAVSISENDSKEVRAQKMANAVRVGKWSYWHENGQLLAEQYYGNDGAMTGVWKSWYKDGKQEFVVDFATGNSTFWFQNGQKFEEGKMLPGMVKDGAWVGYYESGKKNYEGSYKNGQKEGTWNWYDEQGKLYYIEKWHNGVKE